jgi:Matrixin/Putative peptidoglycan binding domain
MYFLKLTGPYGDTVLNLKYYLQRFGFGHFIRGSPLFDDELEKAITLFQTFHKLPVTKYIDKATYMLLLKPRCGNPDIIEIDDKPWNKTNLTFKFDNSTNDLDKELALYLLRTPFQKWAEVCKLTFTEVESNPDISASFHRGNHGHDHEFDNRPGGILAHACGPNIYWCGDYKGSIHFDEDELWSNADPRQFDLFTIALHEYGHALGLISHSNDWNSVMWGYFEPGQVKRDLYIEDIIRIQTLYGVKYN